MCIPDPTKQATDVDIYIQSTTYTLHGLQIDL